MDPAPSPLDRYLRHRRFYEVGFWVVFLLEEATANSITTIMDIRRAGVSFVSWGPPVWEFSSVLALLALVPDDQLRGETPLFVLDEAGVQVYLPEIAGGIS